MSLPPRPADGRFGSGPSRVRPEALAALAGPRAGLMGTSHRATPVRALVGEVRAGLRDLFGLPDDWEVVLGNGGATVFWDVAAYSLVRERSAHATHGEFGAKAAVCARTPWVREPVVTERPGGERAVLAPADVDTYWLVQNETSTGVVSPVRRPRHADGSVADGLLLVDATSAAGGIGWDPAEADVYYFSPQKAFGADGGLWVACMSPAAVARTEEIARTDRPIPPSLRLADALAESRKDQTVNTPAIATLILLAEGIAWLRAQGGMAWAEARSRAASGHLYAWAEATPWAAPFVADPELRSPTIATIDLDAAIDAEALRKRLRAEGMVDLDPYRKLGRNGLRVGTFPAVDLADVQALTAWVEHVVGEMRGA